MRMQSRGEMFVSAGRRERDSMHRIIVALVLPLVASTAALTLPSCSRRAVLASSALVFAKPHSSSATYFGEYSDGQEYACNNYKIGPLLIR